MSLWKNKRKADHLEQAAILNEEPDEKFVKQWDVYLEILKPNGGYEGRVGFSSIRVACSTKRGARQGPSITSTIRRRRPMDNERFARDIREAGAEVQTAEVNLATAEATEKQGQPQS